MFYNKYYAKIKEQQFDLIHNLALPEFISFNTNKYQEYFYGEYNTFVYRFITHEIFYLRNFRSIYLQASVCGIAHPRTCLVVNHLLHQQTLYIVFDTCSSFRGLLQYPEIRDQTKTIPLNANVNFRKSRECLKNEKF